MHTLEDLNNGALAGAQAVRLVNLGLTEFPQALFALADTLEVLDLSGNQLSSLPEDLRRLHKLRILFCSNNPFTQLPTALGDCAQLEMVGFKACALTRVSERSLPAQLRWLILTDNQLAELPAALGQRPRLQKLMLSCNQLTTLPDLGNCKALELLRIASNRFQEIPATVLALPNLAWPAVAGNPLTANAEQTALAEAHHHAIRYDELEIGALLGEGASGHIHRATHTCSGQSMAIKVFKAAFTSDGTPQSELAAGLAAAGHPYLLAPLATVEGHPEGRLAVAMPLLPPDYINLAGPPSLASCTRDVYATDTRFTPTIAERLLGCIRGALKHLHARGILHGDLYAHNILWNPVTGEAVLSDFGAAMLSNTLPPADRALLQAIEWRAFAHLEVEIAARTSS
ncbi:MAG: leucine-rich repeat-containing protein kinase family protein [Stenotrophomonas sp.]